MACVVYCLLQRADQLEPLLSRLKAAGVRSRDIAVVLRDGSVPTAARLLEEAPLIQAWWSLLWPLAMYGAFMGHTCSHADCERVISLAQYKARLGA